jgi:hypothetical protein
MLTPVFLESGTTAAQALRRFAAYGLWLDGNDLAVHQRVDPICAALGEPYPDVAQRLARDATKFGVAIRRQCGTKILWYARDAKEVIALCMQARTANAGITLSDLLDLHEYDSVPTIPLDEASRVALGTSVVVDAGWPVGVAISQEPVAKEGFRAARITVGKLIASVRQAIAPEKAQEVVTWPRVEAPDSVLANVPFEVVVGFAGAQQAGVYGGNARLPVTPGQDYIDVTVELSASRAVQATDGWQRVMRVALADVTAAQVRFRLVGAMPSNTESPTLTMLEVRYLVSGAVCGTASRPLAILANAQAAQLTIDKLGQEWPDMVPASPAVNFQPDPNPPDLTIEILKPDRSPGSNEYVCRLYSPHKLSTNMGPFDVALGQGDAKSFAAEVVQNMRLYAGRPLAKNLLESTGKLISDSLPREFFAALREVQALTRTAPTLLIVSAEPYVPWELAWIEPPLDASRPRHLGAQACVGRWLRFDGGDAASHTDMTRVNPALHPTAQITVRKLATMAPWYESGSGLRRLKKAEEEAEALVATYSGVQLEATDAGIQEILDGYGGGSRVQAIHFAGHGNFDASRPDGSALYLRTGTPLQSMLFRSAKFGADNPAVLFLNACMAGIGGEVLGQMGGFPGHSLRGGFSAVLGALWEVNDDVAHDVAIDFWAHALPKDAAKGEPIGAVLRDMRARYSDTQPVLTYLAYVFYGHPRLTLERAQA